MLPSEGQEKLRGASGGNHPSGFSNLRECCARLPAPDLRSAWHVITKHAFHYIPLEKLAPYHNVTPKTDWWSYADAWHLLKKKKD